MYGKFFIINMWKHSEKCHSYLAEVVTSTALGDVDQSSVDKRVQWFGDGEEFQRLVIHSYILDAAFEIPAIPISFCAIWKASNVECNLSSDG